MDSGVRPPVGRQAGVGKSVATTATNATGANNDYDYKVVIVPLNLDKLKRISADNLKNLHLHQPAHQSSHPVRANRQSCSNSIDLSGPSNLPKCSLQQPCISSPKICHICKVTIKGRGGLMLHLSRYPNCKRNSSQHLPNECS